MTKQRKVMWLLLAMVCMTTAISNLHIQASSHITYWFLGYQRIDDFLWFFAEDIVRVILVWCVVILFTKKSIENIIAQGILWLAIGKLLDEFLPRQWPYYQPVEAIYILYIITLTTIRAIHHAHKRKAGHN